MGTFQPVPSAWRGIEPLTKSGHDLVISIHVLCMGGYYLYEANNEASQEFQSIPHSGGRLLRKDQHRDGAQKEHRGR